MKEYLLGIDLGTSGTKTVLFRSDGTAMAAHTVEYPLYQPQNGWAEQEPSDWWRAVQETVQAVLHKSGVAAADIAGVGISGQMHGLVMLDERGEVLHRSILWCDGRTGEECREITETVGAEKLIAITANPALAGFTAGKILWVRKHLPEVYKACRHILLPKDYIRYCLTGQFATEVSDASGMNLLDVPRRQWSDEILNKLDIDPALLGRMYESVDVTGTVTAEAAALTGLAEGTPVVGGAGDNAAAAVGTGTVRYGKAFTTLGTSGVVFAHADSVSIDPAGRVHTFCSAVPGKWAVMSCTLAAGQSLRWLRDTCCAGEVAEAAKQGVDPYELMTALAEKTPIGADGLLFLPYLMGERSPLLDEKARGRVYRPVRRPWPRPPDPRRAGGRYLLPASVRGCAPWHECAYGGNDGLRRRRAERILASNAGRCVRLPHPDRQGGAGGPGAGRGYSGRCWHRCVSLRGERLRCHRQAGYRSVPRCGMWPRL